MPSAMAPLDTMITFAPLARQQRPAAGTSCRWRRRRAPRPSLVTRLEPTLTTMRRAPSAAAQASGAIGGFQVVEARIGLGAARAGTLRHVPVDRLHQRLQPSRVSAEISNTGPFQRKRRTKSLTLRCALFRRHHVQLVQHQPARLVVQRRVVLLQLRDDGLACATGSTPSSNGAMSTMCSSRRVRCRWRRNWWPRPAPSDAPSIRPGNVGDDEALLRRRRAPRPGSGAAW